MIICVFDYVIMSDDSNVIVKSTCQHQHKRQSECGLDNSQVYMVAYMLFLHIWAYEIR